MSEPNQEVWDLYDRDGRPLGRTAVRGAVLGGGEYHLVAQVWVRNQSGQFLIQRRAEQRVSLPNIWATTAGSVIAGEDDRTATVRELREEIGLKIAPSDLHLIFRYRYSGTIASVWFTQQETELGVLTLQKSEVSQVEWATPDQIEKMVMEASFHDYGRDYFSRVFQFDLSNPGSVTHIY